MNSTVELPSGKIIDLTRFVALVPDEETTESKYSLILEGSFHQIALSPQEAISIKKYLQSVPSQNSTDTWNKEEQIRKNQLAIQLLRQHIERLKKELPSPEREAAFEEFKQIIDAERPLGQKLYQD
jgi:hypothetical protein